MDARHTIDELLTILSDMITEAWSMPLSGGKVMLDRERVMELINEIKNVLPTDIQEARAIVASRNELANAARRDADAIIKAAEDRARSLVNESAIYTEAKRAANEIATAAAAKAKDILNNADQKDDGRCRCTRRGSGQNGREPRQRAARCNLAVCQ